MLYVLFVAIATLFISLTVTIATNLHFLYVCALTILAVACAVVINGLTATICRLLPAKFVNKEKKFFNVSAKEKKLYEKMKIRKWKDKVPEIGQFTGFRKNKLDDPKKPEYVDRFLLEIRYGEIGHLSSVLTSFLILLLFPISKIWFAVSIPVAIISALMNLPSFMILRYTSYKLEGLRNRLIKKQAIETRQAEVAITDATV